MSTLVVRTLLTYFIVVFVIRAMGKRQIGEMEPSEFAVTIMISELAAMPIGNGTIPYLNQ